MKLSTTNNFDLIRLFAASQVAITHAGKHLNHQSAWIDMLSIFPGVPIFFFVSGFLIYGSYEKSLKNDRPLKNFFINRFLRLYPALWLCFFLSVAILLFSGYLKNANYKPADLFVWILTSNTFFQFYNPEFLRGFGVGAINGSLWTIAVELQFYLLTPFLFIVFQKGTVTIILVIALFALINFTNTYFNTKQTIPEQLVSVSFLPWLYMFMLGAITYKYKKVLDFISKIHLFYLILSLVLVYFLSKFAGLPWGNKINILGYFPLAALILKLAITKPSLSDRILNRNDISYGIYIFHMPIINYLVYKEVYGVEGYVIALVLTVLIAMLSWFFVERPALRMKKSQLRAN